MNAVITSIVAFLFAIGVLVAVHEWGHYIVARMAGVKVLRFSIGFGKPLWLRRSGPDQTEYCLAAIPLGGYVKLLDEREGEVAPEDAGRAFNHKSVFARVAILVAGPIMNFVFAILAYWVMFVAGVPGLQPFVGDIEPGSAADRAGLVSGERIVAIGEQPIETWEGGVLALLDELLRSDQLAVRVQTEAGVEHDRVIDVTGRLSELTEPGELFVGLGMQPWSPNLVPIIGELTPGESAANAGLLSGDEILQANGEPIEGWTDWVEFVRARPGETVTMLVKRGQSELELDMTIGEARSEAGEPVGRIGAGVYVPDDFFDTFRAEQRYDIGKAFGVAVDRTWAMSVLTVRMVVRMVSGDVSVKNISGPINIAQYAGQSASIGLASFLSFLAVVSLSLGILNLLPIPVLDGGQVVYQVVEALKGSPLSERAQLAGQQVGIVFLVLIMSVAFYNDLTRVFS